MSATVSRNCARFGSFRVIDLSAGGVLFRGARPVAVGDRIDVALALPTGQYVDLAAVVLREGCLHDRTTFATAFLDISPNNQAAIAQVVHDALEQIGKAQVLVVDYSEPTCRSLRERLQRLGLTSFAVTTALEALHVLDAAGRFRAALVNVYLGADDGQEVLSHLAEKHPRVRRVLMSASSTHPELQASAGTTSPGAPQAVLTGAWSDADLKAAVQG